MRDRPPRSILLAFVGVLTLGLVTAGSTRPASALPIVCVPVDPLDPNSRVVCFAGIVGGGLVNLEPGERPSARRLPHFSLFATRLEFDDAPGEGPMIGAVVWSDPNWEGTQLLLESTQINAYGPIAEIEGGREIRGVMSVNGEGAYPFVLQAIDAGPPGSAQDSVELSVGTAAADGAAQAGDFGYNVAGAIVGGDLQLLIPERDSVATN